MIIPSSCLVCAPLAASDCRTRRFWAGSLVAGLLVLAGCGKAPEPTANAQAPTTRGASGSPMFEDITARAGIDFAHQLANGQLDNIMKSDGAGGTILDFDGDGFMDVYLVNSGPVPVLSEAPVGTARLPNALLRNRGDGTFENVTQRAGVEGRGFGTTAAAADYDNDGDTDLLVVNFGELILYRNRGDGTFEDVTGPAGLASHQAGISATFFDADNDGRLDLFVANYLVFDPAIKPPAGTNIPYPGPLSYEPEFNLLYRNRADGTFEDVSERAGIRINGHRGMSVTRSTMTSMGIRTSTSRTTARPTCSSPTTARGISRRWAWSAGWPSTSSARRAARWARRWATSTATAYRTCWSRVSATPRCI
ncbi:MAG: VCBS repeat-containing protein [Opitutaceae bacterium]|nr:VCBS repeat-containing protein [Opitutaceae bacterium]